MNKPKLIVTLFKNERGFWQYKFPATINGEELTITGDQSYIYKESVVSSFTYWAKDNGIKNYIIEEETK